MRNVLQCRKAWVVDIQPHIGTQTFHKATAININFISWFLTYCGVATLQSRKMLWCLVWTWYTKTYTYTMCSYACTQIQRQKLLNIGRCYFRSELTMTCKHSYKKDLKPPQQFKVMIYSLQTSCVTLRLKSVSQACSVSIIREWCSWSFPDLMMKTQQVYNIKPEL